MRTLTTSIPARRTRTRISALGVAGAAALALTACGGGSGGGSATKGSSSTAAGSFPGAQTSSSPSPQQSFDPAAGPVMTPAQLPKTCNGLVTDADLQLALGQPLNGGDYFQSFAPVGAKQTGKVKCQYGVVQDPSGKVTGNQVEIQLAIYADAATAQSHGASTVGDFAGQGDQYAPISVGGHPATYVTEAGKDTILVMYDGNRTFLITTADSLVKGDDAKTFVVKIAAALYKHTTPDTPAGGATPSSGAGGTPGASGSATPGAPSAPSSASGSAPAGGNSAPAGTPAPGGSAPTSPVAD